MISIPRIPHPFSKQRSLSLILPARGIRLTYKYTEDAFRGLSFQYKPAGKGFGGDRPWFIQVMKHTASIRPADHDDQLTIERKAKTIAWINFNPFSRAPRSPAAALQPILLPFTRKTQ